MNSHQMVSLIAGDTWTLTATMLDPSGSPIIFNDPSQIEWLMYNPRTQQPVFTSGQFQLMLGSSHGTVTVTVQPGVTTTVPACSPVDWWRINVNGVVQTLLTGPYSITADPFAAAVSRQTMPFRPPPSQAPLRRPTLLVANSR